MSWITDTPQSLSNANRPERTALDLPEFKAITTLDELRRGDPTMYHMWDEIRSAIENGMLPDAALLRLIEAMPQATQRDMVHRVAGMDASLLLSFKNTMRLIEKTLEEVLASDEYSRKSGITAKEAMNMQIRLSTTMARDMPKFIKLESVQRQERALTHVMETLLTKEQQKAVLDELDRIAAAESSR